MRLPLGSPYPAPHQPAAFSAGHLPSPVLQFAGLLRLINLQSAVFLPPAVLRLIRDPNLLADLPDGLTRERSTSASGDAG